MLLHFAQRSPRDRVDSHETPRHFERREILAAEPPQIAGVELSDDERDRHFAAQLVRDAHDRGFLDALLFDEKLLDLAGIDIESAGDDQVAPPA